MVWIDTDERYQDAFFAKNVGDGVQVDIDDATVERWRRVIDEYDAVQVEMLEAIGHGE